jgi:hypothetical protein
MAATGRPRSRACRRGARTKRVAGRKAWPGPKRRTPRYRTPRYRTPRCPNPRRLKPPVTGVRGFGRVAHSRSRGRERRRILEGSTTCHLALPGHRVACRPLPGPPQRGTGASRVCNAASNGWCRTALRRAGDTSPRGRPRRWRSCPGRTNARCRRGRQGSLSRKRIGYRWS